MRGMTIKKSCKVTKKRAIFGNKSWNLAKIAQYFGNRKIKAEKQNTSFGILPFSYFWNMTFLSFGNVAHNVSTFIPSLPCPNKPFRLQGWFSQHTAQPEGLPHSFQRCANLPRSGLKHHIVQCFPISHQVKNGWKACLSRGLDRCSMDGRKIMVH